ncbi:MAG: TonB-dependent receptor [Bacteroidetes bacterium]|nr:TonB-dependent receptor [Bacteroidota bacterium]
MKKVWPYLLGITLCLFVIYESSAQEIRQVIRGEIRDKDSKAPLPGATVILLSDTFNLKGVVTNERGEFRLEQVLVGRHSIKVTYMGYKPLVVPGIILTSGKEVILNLELEESAVSMQQVEISANRKETAINEMAIVSARTFAVEETDRYAGSRGDPARMASNFAGVQGANDTRNDIIVRGNSPMGILWRLNGIDIPNPNHFAIQGSTGGPVSILNNKVLANSDFFTGAFPAEFGNSIAGVFDVNMRNGNNEKHEFTGQFGFLGTELTAEGPISKEKRSSYLINYRYSTLKMFESFKIPIGTSAVPNYQDGAFKLNFPTKKGNLTFFGIGGVSQINIILSTATEQAEELYGLNNRDQYFGTSMGVVGASYTHFINSSTFSKLTIAGSFAEGHSRHDLVKRDSAFQVSSITPIFGYKSVEEKLTLSYFINKKFDNRHSLKSGLFLHRLHSNMSDSLYRDVASRFVTRIDYQGEEYLIQPYIQYRFKINNELEFTAGLHSQYFTLTQSTTLEPRGGVKWILSDKQILGFGAGMHSQHQPLYIHYHQHNDIGAPVFHNRNLDFSKSNHFVISYDYFIQRNLRFRAETYYQHLYNIPVEINPSAYSIINQGTSFTRFFPDSLQNTGTGKNYGVEFTLEKFFSKDMFFLVTASVFDSKYKGSDGVERDTDYNTHFATNFLLGKEFKLNKNSVLGVSAKSTWAGGRRFTPIDIKKSLNSNEAVFIDDQTNTGQFRNYYRADLRVHYRINRKKISHEIALDLVNVLNRKNVLALSYAPNPSDATANPMREEYQLGFLPLFYYKIDF